MSQLALTGRSAVALRIPPVVYPLLGSALAWVVLFATLPSQDFPLIDDWAFARGAFLFSRGEGIHYGNWASMPQLGQWLWSCPFLWLLGPSHVALRLSTVCLSWLGLWAFCDLLGQAGWPARRAALATAALAFDPLFFLLQGTFMTDVPALSFALLALAAYARGLRGGAGRWLVLACVWACLGALTRQNTLAVSAAACVLLWQQRELRRGSLAWLAVLLPAALGLAVHLWFQTRQDIIPVSPRPLPPDSMLLLPFLVVTWCGLGTLPLLVGAPLAGSWRARAGVFALLLAFAVYWYHQGSLLSDLDGPFPYTGTMVTPWGVGSGDLGVGERPIVLGWGVRLFLTLLGCLAGTAFVLRALAWRRRVRLDPLLLFCLCQAPFILVAPALWDRYLLVLFPGALYLAGDVPEAEQQREPIGWRWLGPGAVAGFALVSVIFMHDWLAWNAASWELGRRAVAHHVDPHDIEGGVEWDGYHALDYQKSLRRSWRDLYLNISQKAGPPRRLTLATTRLWFPHVTGRYALSFSELRGTATLDSEPYRLWLLPGRRRFYLLQDRSPAPERGVTSSE